MLGAVTNWQLPGSLVESHRNQVNDICLLVIPTLRKSLENSGLDLFRGGGRIGSVQPTLAVPTD